MKLIVLHKTKAACLAVCAILVVATAIGIAIRASHADMAAVIAREENESYEAMMAAEGVPPDGEGQLPDDGTDAQSGPDGEAAPEDNPDGAAPSASPEKKNYIKWVDFDIPYEALKKALDIDIKSAREGKRIDWVEMLAYLGTKYGGDFTRYKAKDMDAVVEKLNSGKTMADLTADVQKYYPYYHEAYSAILGEFVGDYKVQVEKDGVVSWQEKRGLKVFSPIARGYDFAHYEDFGNSRSYGYQRKHLGHDLMGAVGTPIVAVESGTIEVLGWNQYGGWRVGIRSFDQKRYYYYAHMRKNHPYNYTLKEGDVVKAGDVIGYLGMTGYSTKENVNNINTPHLHFGLQLIFDESQKDGVNQIWIDLYDIVKLLQENRSYVYKDEETKDYFRKYDYYEPLLEGRLEDPSIQPPPEETEEPAEDGNLQQ